MRRRIPRAISVSGEAIADLRRRLNNTRLPDYVPGSDPWEYGTDPAYFRSLIEYWSNSFDWREQEAKLNAFKQIRVTIDGIAIHALHVKGKGPSPTPILLLHGWPGSVFEFLDIIPRLTDPAAYGGDPKTAFTVIVPSLPGYGLSFTSGQRRLGIAETADCLKKLMVDTLGYDGFAVQGGDWGSGIGTRMAYVYPQHVIGLHLNLLMAAPRTASDYPDPTPDEQRYLEENERWVREESGYQWIQGTKPQTLAYALTDSPSGLAAWMIEKFRAWSDCDGRPETAISRDRLLSIISLYWFTGAINSSFWLYYARRHGEEIVPPGAVVHVATAYAAFPKEVIRPPRSGAERLFSNLRRWREYPRGGHFPAMEQPEVLARDITEFFEHLRTEGDVAIGSPGR